MTKQFDPIDHVALVLEGGGFRGIYTAGVLDALMREQLFFNYLIGVSAGAAYSVSYVSRQFGRNLAVNNFVNDPRYCGWGNLFRLGTYFNWEFVYKTLPTQIIPFDYRAFYQSTSRVKVVVANIATGQAEYKELHTDDPDTFRDWLTATSSLPYISKPINIGGQLYLDGGLADSIPVHKALADGNQRAIVVLTREKGYRKKPMRNEMLMKLFYRKYPNLIALMKTRAHHYNRTLDELEQLEHEGKVFVIRPPEAIAVSRLENNPDHLKQVYNAAMAQMDEVMPKLREWLKQGQ